MRRLTWMILLTSAAAFAQQSDPVSLSALDHGRLVVWIVTPASAIDRARAEIRKRPGIPNTVVEKTSSEFGQAASNVGTNASSYGQTASSYGTNASNVGTNASNAGRSPSSVGTSASNYGANASNYGQTASSYGTNASDFGKPTSAANESLLPKPVDPTPVKTTLASMIESRIHSAFPELELKVASLSEADLSSNLSATAGTKFYPDILFGANGEDPSSLPGVVQRTLGPNQTSQSQQSQFAPDATGPPYLLRRAPNLAAARAFALWYREGSHTAWPGSASPTPDTLQAANVAKAAEQAMLTGGTLGGAADKDAAPFSGSITQYLALANSVVRRSASDLGSLNVQVDITSASARRGLAIVSMRGIVFSADAFGTVHSQATLRKDPSGAWKVLELSLSLTKETPSEAISFGERNTSNKAVKFGGVSLASPPDGDNRPTLPELWWDNQGEAAVRVIEWQTRADASWSGPNLQLVRSEVSELKTRVTAAFAKWPGTYRWRVWSIDDNGAIILSGWRSFNILQQ